MNPREVLIGPSARLEASGLGLETLCRRASRSAGSPDPLVRQVTSPEELFEDLEARMMGSGSPPGPVSTPARTPARTTAQGAPNESSLTVLIYDPSEASPAFEAAVWRWHSGKHGPRKAVRIGSEDLPWPPTEESVSRILEFGMGGSQTPRLSYFGESPPLQAHEHPPTHIRLSSEAPGRFVPGAGSADLSTIEAILRSPRQDTSHSPHLANGNGSTKTDRAAADLGSSGYVPRDRVRPERPRPGPGNRWPKAQPGTEPQTAFLRSPALGARPGDAPREAPLPDLGASHHPGAADVPNLLAQDSNAPLLSREEIDAFFAPAPALEDGAPPIGGTTQTEGWPPAGESWDLEDEAAEHDQAMALQEAQSAPPSWMKRQVADLADIVQSLELVARSHQAHVPLADELTRLRQFTKTVAYVASPPPRGSLAFDVATLAEEALGALAGKTPDAPRILFRRRGEGTGTLADKELVASALDAILQTAIACSRSGDVVRVTVDGRSGALVSTEIEFPKGPLADRQPAEIVRPYGIQDLLPMIGPNALAAAGAIAVGQGGELTLSGTDEDNRVFRLELPSA